MMKTIASEEEKETSLTSVWDHAVETLFKLSTVLPVGNNRGLNSARDIPTEG